MGLFEQINDKLESLSNTERNILNYVIKNIYNVKKMPIRQLAAATFVSTATISRLSKKLGFSGYDEFLDSIKETELQSRKLHTDIPNVMHKIDYQDEYLKNIIEAVKVISKEKIAKFAKVISRYPKIYVLGQGLSEEVGQYARRILMILGFHVEMPREEFEIRSLKRRIRRDDVLMVFSYTGNDPRLIKYIEEVMTIATPMVISFTRADNNLIQTMSDINFYVFSDEISYDKQDLTSHIGMIAVFETLMNQVLADITGKD